MANSTHKFRQLALLLSISILACSTVGCATQKACKCELPLPPETLMRPVPPLPPLPVDLPGSK